MHICSFRIGFLFLDYHHQTESMKIISFAFSCIFLLQVNICFADTFTVVNNADSGPGSLRQAIIQANANGTTVPDRIDFNIPDLTEAGRLINLQSALPAITSNITIDGSTQAGTPLSISGAKVTLYVDHFISHEMSMFSIENANNVSIFGMCLSAADDWTVRIEAAIKLRSSHDITIGAPGKGNLFDGMTMALLNTTAVTDFVWNLKVQGNIFGLRLVPTAYRGGGSIYLYYAHNITIGGETEAERNIFTDSYVWIQQSFQANPDFLLKAENNWFNYNGTSYSTLKGHIFVGGNFIADPDPTRVKTLIRNNVFSSSNLGGAVGLSYLSHKAIIQSNKLGTDITGTICKGQENGISISSCKEVIIGGHTEEEQNIIMGNLRISSPGVHIIKNQIYGDIDLFGTANPSTIKVLEYENGRILGKSSPNSKIQIYTRTCYTYCSTRKYIATTFSDGNGDWSYNYPTGSPIIIATATRADSSTSEFTKPRLDRTYAIKTNASCGRSNGSITGIKIFEGTHIRWINNNTGQVVSTDTNLYNAPAGQYTLEVANGQNGCPDIAMFSIDDIQLPPSLSNLQITHTSCGKANGMVRAETYGHKAVWKNAQRDSIASGSYVSNLLPGNYYLVLSIAADPTCYKEYGPFLVNNQSGPTLNTNNILINAATCGNANGNIAGLTYTNQQGSVYLEWRNEANEIVSNSLPLTNQPSGKYLLKFKDRSGCDTIITPYFIIPSSGVITISEQSKNVTQAGCTLSNGAISGINVTGANAYTWTALPSMNITGNTVDVSGLPSGNYQLTATNSFGCSLQSSVINIPTSKIADIVPDKAWAFDGNCGTDNAWLKVEGFTNEQALQSYYWINSNTGQQLSTSLHLTGLGAGTYEFIAIDTNGCKGTIFRSTVKINPKPIVNTSDVIIANDNCNLQHGWITGISISGLLGPTEYSWVRLPGTPTGTDNINLVSGGAQGNYLLTVKDNLTCEFTIGPFTIQNSDVFTQPQYSDVTIVRSSNAVLKVNNRMAGNYFLYADAAGTQLLAQNITGEFTTPVVTEDRFFYVKHQVGTCVSQLVPVKISVIDKSMFAIPKAFTPNNDGLNDRLVLRVLGLVEIDYFRIFNRNGEEVFSSKQIEQSWDGRWKGQPQPGGVYIWMAQGKDLNGVVVKDKGTITLIR
jgi:gliding motility-associated-like protein